MTNIVVNIPTLQIPVAQPQPQVQHNSAQGNNSQANTQNQQTSQNQQTQNNNSNQANSAQDGNASQSNNASQGNNNNYQSNQNSHFSKLLSSQQPATTKGAGGNKQGNAQAPDASQVDNSNLAAVVAYLSAQIQQDTPSANSDASTQIDVVGAAGGNNTSSTSDAALLQELKQLLQQALVATSGTAQPANTDTTATGLLAANDVNATSTAAASTTTDGSATDATALKQTLDQLIAMLQAGGAKTTTDDTANTALTAATANTATDATATQAANADANAVLKLAQALDDKLNAAQSTATTAATASETTQSAAATATAIANAAATPVNSTTPKTKLADITDTTQPATTTVAAGDTKPSTSDTILQSAVSQLSGFIAHSHSDKIAADIIDSANSFTAISAQTANASSLGANANINNNSNSNNNYAPAAANNDFTKFMSSSNTNNNSPSDQVLVQIRNQANQGLSSIKIQLQPADLGRVTVQMNTGTDGKTGITVTADNRQTLSMLQSDARHLEAALRNVGIKTTSGGLSFNLSGQQQQQQQNQAKSGSYTQVAAATSIDDDADYYGTVVASYRMSAQQGLDIRV